MKTNFNYNFNIKFLIILILFIGLFSFYKSVTLKAGQTDAILAEFNNENTEIIMAAHDDPGKQYLVGWAWSPVIGWVSLSCLNDFDGNDDGVLENHCIDGEGEVDYGLYWEENKIKGCAWSPGIGWICFSDEEFEEEDPHSGVPIEDNNYLDDDIVEGFADIFGYQYIGNFDQNKLGFPLKDEVANFPYPIEGCFNCTSLECQNEDGDVIDGDCSGGEESCGEDGLCVHTGNYTCANCLQYNYCRDDNPDYVYDDDYYFDDDPVTGACLLDGCDDSYDDDNFCYRLDEIIGTYSSFNCSDCTPGGQVSCEESSYTEEDGSLTFCESCANLVYETPGTILDKKPLSYTDDVSTYDRYNLCGFAWNSSDTDDDGVSNLGLGYLQFSPQITVDFNPYFAVERGSIYSGGSITGSEFLRPGAYHSRYLIKAKGAISNMISSLGSGVGLLQNITGYEFLTDPEGIGKYSNKLGTIDVNGLIAEATPDYNKHGSYIATYLDVADIENKVILVNDNATLPAGDYAVGGSGIVVVEGNLTINGNITYADAGGSITNLNQIDSLVWIVRGDVYINSSVTEIVGTFIVLGDGSEGSGEFNSGGGGIQLSISGNVIAQKFVLERIYYAGPAERFINDGRIQANPSAGLIDFSKALPRFSNRVN